MAFHSSSFVPVPKLRKWHVLYTKTRNLRKLILKVSLKCLSQIPSPESHNGPLRGFRIYYRLDRVSGNQFITKRIENQAATAQNADGLVQNTAYEIKVQAYNDAGGGTNSSSITVTTADAGKLCRLFLTH